MKVFIINVASLRKSERLISSRDHGCFTISPPQLPAAATRFPSHGSSRTGLELRTATRLSSAGFEPTAVQTFGLRVRCLNHSDNQSWCANSVRHVLSENVTINLKLVIISAGQESRKIGQNLVIRFVTKFNLEHNFYANMIIMI